MWLNPTPTPAKTDILASTGLPYTNKPSHAEPMLLLTSSQPRKRRLRTDDDEFDEEEDDEQGLYGF